LGKLSIHSNYPQKVVILHGYSKRNEPYERIVFLEGLRCGPERDR